MNPETVHVKESVESVELWTVCGGGCGTSLPEPHQSWCGLLFSSFFLVPVCLLHAVSHTFFRLTTSYEELTFSLKACIKVICHA